MSLPESSNQRCILLPVDGSDNANRAYEFYQNNLMHEGDHIVVVHVLEPPNLPTMGYGMNISTAELTKILQEHSRKATALEQTWCEKLNAKGMSFKYQHVMNNKPGAGIVELANESNADIIIMGNRGLGTIRRTILGSVSDYVLHHTKVPIIIVPPTNHK